MPGEGRSVTFEEMDEVEFERIAAAISDSMKQIVEDIVDDVGPLYMNWIVSELSTYVNDRVKQHGPSDSEATSFLNLLDRAISEGNVSVRDAISVSVVEGSKWNHPELHSLFGPNLKRDWYLNREQENVFGPNLRIEWQQQEEWYRSRKVLLEGESRQGAFHRLLNWFRRRKFE